MSAVDLAEPVVVAPGRAGGTGRFLRSELGMVFRRRRNQVILAVLAAVIVGGLVHYGRGLGDDRRGRTSASGAPT